MALDREWLEAMTQSYFNSKAKPTDPLPGIRVNQAVYDAMRLNSIQNSMARFGDGEAVPLQHLTFKGIPIVVDPGLGPGQGPVTMEDFQRAALEETYPPKLRDEHVYGIAPIEGIPPVVPVPWSTPGWVRYGSEAYLELIFVKEVVASPHAAWDAMATTMIKAMTDNVFKSNPLFARMKNNVQNGKTLGNTISADPMRPPVFLTNRRTHAKLKDIMP
jgi:hypothetical protein